MEWGYSEHTDDLEGFGKLMRVTASCSLSLSKTYSTQICFISVILVTWLLRVMYLLLHGPCLEKLVGASGSVPQNSTELSVYTIGTFHGRCPLASPVRKRRMISRCEGVRLGVTG